MPTNFSNKTAILADLWINYRQDKEFADFIEYNDLGLPLAYFINVELVEPSDQAVMYVDETFNILCSALGLDPEGEYETLNGMFDKGVEEE